MARTTKPKPAAPEETGPVLPVHEGVQVVEVLEDGRETETHFHCKMANGTTQHVPKSLFLTYP